MMDAVTLRDFLWFICGCTFGGALGILAMCLVNMCREERRDV